MPVNGFFKAINKFAIGETRAAVIHAVDHPELSLNGLEPVYDHDGGSTTSAFQERKQVPNIWNHRRGHANNMIQKLNVRPSLGYGFGQFTEHSQIHDDLGLRVL